MPVRPGECCTLPGCLQLPHPHGPRGAGWDPHLSLDLPDLPPWGHWAGQLALFSLLKSLCSLGAKSSSSADLMSPLGFMTDKRAKSG